MFKLSLPLSYPSSSSESSHSKASFKVVMKWPNNISLDKFHNCCEESLQKKCHVDSFYGIAEDVLLKICHPKL